MDLFEIRTYRIKDNGMDEWVTFMEERVVPFVTARGMKVHAMFRGAEDPSVFTWIRSFKDDAAREALYKAVYEDEEWLANMKPTVMRLLDKPKNQILTMHRTPASPL